MEKPWIFEEKTREFDMFHPQSLGEPTCISIRVPQVLSVPMGEGDAPEFDHQAWLLPWINHGLTIRF